MTIAHGVGIDEAWDRATPAQVLAYGASFIIRYVGEDTTGKNLTEAEARAYGEAGLDIVTNYEYQPRNALLGRAEGVRVARLAETQHRACGGSEFAPVYFSVDFNATTHDYSMIADFFSGTASVLGVARNGAYAEYEVMKMLFDLGVIRYGLQTYAWSPKGIWDPRAQIRQVANGIHVAGHNVDRDEAQAPDFGQWRYGMALTQADADMLLDRVVYKRKEDGFDCTLRIILTDIHAILLLGRTQGGPAGDSYVLRQLAHILDALNSIGTSPVVPADVAALTQVITDAVAKIRVSVSG